MIQFRSTHNKQQSIVSSTSNSQPNKLNSNENLEPFSNSNAKRPNIPILSKLNGSSSPRSLTSGLGLGLKQNLSKSTIGNNNFGQAPENGGLFTQQQCHQIAKNIIQTYDGDHDNVCQTMEVAKWLVDCYRAMNKKFQPTATDIASYVQVIARNDSGKVSLDDLENFIARFFYNPQK